MWGNIKLCNELGLNTDDWKSFDPKGHTVRAGHRFKPGDIVSLRVWGNDVNPKSGRSGPYHSKQIIIAPDIQVKKTWDFEIDACGIYSIAKPGEQLKYMALVSCTSGLFYLHLSSKEITLLLACKGCRDS